MVGRRGAKAGKMRGGDGAIGSVVDSHSSGILHRSRKRKSRTNPWKSPKANRHRLPALAMALKDDDARRGRRPPLVGIVPAEIRRRASWIEPQILVQVAFSEFTRDGMARRLSYMGIREHKSAAVVHRERPTTLADAIALAKRARRGTGSKATRSQAG